MRIYSCRVMLAEQIIRQSFQLTQIYCFILCCRQRKTRSAGNCEVTWVQAMVVLVSTLFLAEYCHRLAQWPFLGRLFDRVDLIKPVSNVRLCVHTYVWNTTRRYRSVSDARRFAVWPDPRPRSRALHSWKSSHFQKLSPLPFTMGAGNWPRILKTRAFVRSLVCLFFAGRDPAYSGPLLWNLYTNASAQGDEGSWMVGVCGVCAHCVGWRKAQ